MRRGLRDPVLSHFRRTPTCDGRTDRQTHDDSKYDVARIKRDGLAHIFISSSRGQYNTGNNKIIKQKKIIIK